MIIEDWRHLHKAESVVCKVVPWIEKVLEFETAAPGVDINRLDAVLFHIGHGTTQEVTAL